MMKKRKCRRTCFLAGMIVPGNYHYQTNQAVCLYLFPFQSSGACVTTSVEQSVFIVPLEFFSSTSLGSFQSIGTRHFLWMWGIYPTLLPFLWSQYRFPYLSGMVSNIVSNDLPLRSLFKVWTLSDEGDMPGKAGFYQTEDLCAICYFLSDRGYGGGTISQDMPEHKLEFV